MSAAAKPLPDVIRRMQATQATLDRYRGREWAWAAGHTCAHMARFHLRAMGHRPERLPAFRSLIGARRALDARGWASAADMLDAQPGLSRLPGPAFMLAGDLAFRSSEDGLGGLLIYVDRHKFMGWFEDYDGCVVMDMAMDQLEMAWRA